MGKTSSTVKDRYNKKAYDEIKIRVAKGEKEKIQTYATNNGESVNSFVNRAIDETMQRDVSTTPALPPKKESLPQKGKPRMIVTQTDEDVDGLTEDIPMWKKCLFPSEEAYNAQIERAKDSETDDGYGFDEIIANHAKEKEVKESDRLPWEDD